MPAITSKTLRNAALHIAADAAPAERWAAEELQRYLQRLTGAKPIIEPAPALAPHAIGIGTLGSSPQSSTASDATTHEISASSHGIGLGGGSPRALLNAVYALLEQLGCRWSLHGPDEEHVPQSLPETVEITAQRRSAPFNVRGYCADIMTWHYTQPEHFHDRLHDDRRFIDWMGKSGANTFFFIRHPFDTQLTIPELLPDFARRGIDVEYGGHVLPLLLPRDLFAAHPDYFPTSPQGDRSDTGNLCTSSRGALSTVSSNAASYVRDYPEMTALHIWGADLWKGGWCRCSSCQPISPQDQSLRVCNAVAGGLSTAGLSRPVCYLAYHDTLDADLSEKPAAEVVCEFAPRERCYAHAMNDPQCETNRRYAAALERYVEAFDGRVRLFEYYGDAILFFGCAVPLTQVIAADMQYYRSLGIRDVLMLQFGHYSVWAYPLNFLSFAAAADGIDPSAGHRDYCARFSREQSAAQNAFAELESVLQTLVTYGDIRLKPRKPDALQRLQISLASALPRLGAIAERLEACSNPELRSQAMLLRYTQAVFGGIEHEIHSGGNADTIYADALRLLESVDRRFKGLWGELDLPIIHSFFSAAAFMDVGSSPAE